MAQRVHRYALTLTWTGNRGTGTSNYNAYDRSYQIAAGGKAEIAGSSQALFRGDATRWNPEELLVAALSACHQLWYLHLAADAGIVVTAYRDLPEGAMQEAADGSGRMTSVTLRPHVTVAPGSDVRTAVELHDAVHAKCAIGNSVNFPIKCEPTVEAG